MVNIKRQRKFEDPWVYMVMSPDAWAIGYTMQMAYLNWRTCADDKEGLSTVLLVHPNTCFDKDGDIRYPKGLKPKVLGMMKRGKLIQAV